MTRAWVRVMPDDGRLVVTWVTIGDRGVESGGERPLTRWERIQWWAAKRVPKVGAS